MRRGRVLLALILLAIGSPERAWALHFPPFDSLHDLFQADDGDENLAPGSTKCGTRGSPLEVATGDFIQTIPVLSIAGRGPAINLLLTYHSFEHRRGAFGIGWTSSYDERIVKATDGVTITAICAGGTGQRDRYARRADGSYAGPGALHNTLTETPGGLFVLREKDGAVRTFDASGRLSSIVDRNGNTLTLTRDATGFLTAITDASGRAVSLTKGANGRVTTLADPANRQFAFAYDSNGNLASLADPLGNATTLQYDAGSRLIALADPKGNVLLRATYNPDGTLASYTEREETWRIAYNPALGQTTETDSSNNIWTHVYNIGTGQINRTVDPLGGFVFRQYDVNSNPALVTDQNGHTTIATFDVNSNPRSLQDALGNTVRATYDPTFNFPLTVTDALGNVTAFTYDAKGNLTKVTDPIGNATQYQYNAVGQLIAIIDASGQSSSLSYDTYGNIITATDPLGNVRRAAYDVLGNVQTVRDASGRTEQFFYDGDRRLTRSDDINGGRTIYSYDKSGNLTSITTANGAVTSYAYDALNRVIQSTNPLGAITAYAYDRKDNLTTRTDASGAVTLYRYDPLGRLIRKDLPNDIVTYSYDKVGQLLALGNNGNTTTLSYTYDAADRLSQVRTSASIDQPATTVSYTYDANGRRVGMTDPTGGVTTYTYDAASRLTSLRDPSASAFNFTYDSVSRRTGLTGPLGRAVTYAWDAASRLRILTDSSASAGLTFSYNYDPNGNLLSKVDTGNNTYTYDALSRLTSAAHPAGQPAESYAYDAMGNRTASSLSATYAHDAANRLRADATYNYDYDANGNHTRRTERATGKASNYAYDSDNRLASLTLTAEVSTNPQGTLVATYKYDGLGRRIAKIIAAPTGPVTTSYVYDGTDIVAEYSGGVLAATYTHGPGVDEPLSVKRGATISYFQRDALGSVVRTFSAAGTNNTYQYDSYGRIVSSTGTAPAPYAFTGREYDAESGLYFYRARHYNPGVGRFISEDPIGFAGGSNLYSYVGENPIGFVDPSGENPLLVGAIVGGLTGAGADLAFQLLGNGGRLGCVNWRSVATSGAMGAAAGAVLSFLAPEAVLAGRGAAAESGASSSFQGARLSEHLRQLEKYGSHGFKELESGSFRYYGGLKEATTHGEMAGARLVREWNPFTGGRRTWLETLDHAGTVRSVRPVTDGPKVHYIFDAYGRFIGIR